MVDTLPSILVVDDRPENLYAMKAILRKLDAEVVCVASGEEALKILLEKDFCLAIVDVQMPEMDGYELVELIRSSANTSALPVIFVSAIYSDEYNYRKGYDAGAVDFLSKPVNADILLSKVKVFIQLWQQKLELQNLINRLQDWNTYLENTVRERTEALKSANAVLSNQMVLQNELFTTATGELDSALAGMRHWVSTLKSITKSRSTELDLVNKILASEQVIQETLTAMADSTQIADGLSNLTRKPALLQEILAAACDDCRIPLDEHNVTIRVENLNTLPAVQADAQLVQLLFRQIILHAVRYTPEGGEVGVAAEPFPASYLPQVNRETVRVSFAFQGPGLDLDYLAWVSAVLQNAELLPANSGDRQGSSLGLIMAQKITDAHGGRLWAEACGPAKMDSAGVIFHVLLPC